MKRIKLIDLSAEVFICCGPVCLERLGKAYFPRKATSRQWETVPLCCSSSTLPASASEKTKLSCSHFASTRLHPPGRHPIRLLPFSSIRDCKTSHPRRVPHSSDLHAGSLRACCSSSWFPLPCTPPLSRSPLSSPNGRLTPTPEPQCHGTRA